MLKEEMIHIQQGAEQRKANIMENAKDSLIRFQQLSPKLTNQDIDNVRKFISACLVEEYAIVAQIETEIKQ